MPDFARTPRATVRRKAQRASYARADVYAILDEAPFCNVGFVEDGRPVVIPVNHWRIGDFLYFTAAGQPPAGSAVRRARSA